MPEDVILEKIKGLAVLIEEKFKTNDEAHERIEGQTRKTNGRVSSLESWRAYITGAIAVITVIILPLVFMVVSLFLNK
jgi:hypothetical protein